MAEEQKIGQLLDTLGVTAELNPGDMVTDVLVLMKSVNSEGQTEFHMARNEGLDWITRLGMLNAADRLEGNRFDNIDNAGD